MKRVNKRPVDHFEGKWEKGKKYTLYALVKNNGTLFRSLTPKEKDEPYVIYDSTNETFSANPGWEIVEMSEDSRLSAMGGNGGGASGQDGKDAGFGTISASVANTSGNPSVAVETSGPDTAKNIFFKFFGLKGNQGIPGVNNADIKVVDALPAASAQTTGRIYLVETETANIYARWYTEVDGSTYAWRQLGTTEVALEDYATKDNLSQLRQEVTDDVSQLEAKVTDLEDKTEDTIVHTKNLADKAIRGDGYYINSNNIIVAESGNMLIIFPCLGNTTYTMSKIKTTRFRIAYFEQYPNNFVQGYGAITDHNATHLTITTGENATYIAAWVYNSSGETVTKDAVMASLQIELGSEATAYVIPGCGAVDNEARGMATALENRVEDLEDEEESLRGDIETVGQKVTRLEIVTKNIDIVSDNDAVNGFFKELYLIGVNYQDVASINVQGYRANAIICIFKDSENNTLASLKSNAPLSDTFISQDHSGKIMLASVDWDNLDSVKAAVNACSLTEKVGNLGKNPNIVEFLSRKVMSDTIPAYTRTTGYGINDNGEVVSGGSSHFYTSPIAVKGGDCIIVRTLSRANASIISLTDGRGSYYKPIAVYTGNDPDYYFYKVKDNGFVAIAGYNNELFLLTVFRDSEIAEIYDKFKENEDATIAEMKSTPVDLRKRDSSVYVGADIDTDWESVDGATKTNSIQFNNVTRKKVRCATIVGPSNNGIARVGFTKSVNANIHPFLFSICIGDYSDTENAPAGDVNLLFYSGQGFVSSQRMKIPLQVATQYPEYNPVFNRNGWFCLCAFLPSCDGQGVEVGQSFDPTNVTGFGVYLVNSRNLPVTVHIERMDFLDVVMTKPGIVTIIDNFNPQVPAMADYAYSKGVRLNLSIIPGYYEGAPGAPTCASKEEIARLAAQGHFIWNHTWSHPNFNDITVPQIHDQINLAERWMQLNGYGEGKRIVSIPSARFNTRSCNAALDTNVEMFFHSWVREAKQVYIPFAPVARLLPTTWLDTDALAAGMSGADIATVALKCLTYNGLTVIGFHGTYITNEGGGMENWQAYIDAIAASDAYHYGLDEILEGGWN